MRRISPLAALVVALAFVLPAPAAKKEKVALDKKEAAAQLVAAGTVRGKVVHVEADKKMFNLEITVSYAAPNANAAADMANLKLQLLTARDLGTRRNLMVQLMQKQAQMSAVKHEKHSFDVMTAGDVVVRAANPPAQFDEKGNVKRYTAKELKELKGDNPKLPGYTSDFDSLRPDQYVEVHFAKPKDQPKAKTNNKNKDADKDNDALAETSKPTATMIIILSEPPAK